MPSTQAAPAPGAAPTAPDAVALHGTFGSLLLVNLGSAIAAALLLAGLIYLRPGVPAAAFPLLYAALLLYLVIDTLHWLWRGVHRTVLDGETLHVYRGRELRHQRYPVSEITDVHLNRRATRRSLQILLGGRVLRIPGATFYPGRKMWITSDAFDHAGGRPLRRGGAALRPAATLMPARLPRGVGRARDRPTS